MKNRRFKNSKLRSPLNNDSSNSSLPPSTDQKCKKANEYNGREKSKKRSGGQIGHKGTTSDADKIRRKIDSGELKHEVVDIGDPNRRYKTRYKTDIQVIPTAIELQFHEDETGKIYIPKRYRNKVVYGDMIQAIAVDLYGEGVVSLERIRGFLHKKPKHSDRCTIQCYEQ